MIDNQRKFGVFGTLCKCNIIIKADTKFLLKLLFLNFCVTLIYKFSINVDHPCNKFFDLGNGFLYEWYSITI